MAGTTKAKPTRRTQAERRAATQDALLRATIDCLVEYGYRDSTTARIADRAGVSRGAQVHHFPTKADLVAAAISHLARRRAEHLTGQAKRLPPGRDRVTGALDLLWAMQTGPLAEATLELWVTARTDAELREKLVPVEREVAEQTRAYGRELFGEYAERPEFDRRLEIALGAIRGFALISVLTPRRSRKSTWQRRRDELATLF